MRRAAIRVTAGLMLAWTLLELVSVGALYLPAAVALVVAAVRVRGVSSPAPSVGAASA